MNTESLNKCKVIERIIELLNEYKVFQWETLREVSKYGVISGPNTGKHGQEITSHLDTFHVVQRIIECIWSYWMNIELLNNDKFFLWYDWPTKGVLPSFQPGPLAEILTIANFRRAAIRIWSCAVQAVMNEVVR